MMHSIQSLTRWSSDHQRHAWVGTTLLILTVHLLSVVLLSSSDLMPDEQRYINIAENLLTTGIFGPEPGVPFALNAPFYPYLVASLFIVSGHSLLVVRIVQAILGTVNGLVTFRLARALFPKRPAVAWLSMLSVGLYPVFFLWEGLILTETLYILTVQLSCWWWIRSVQSPTFKRVLMAGIGFGLSMLVRETLCIFVPLAVLAALLIIRQRRVRYVALFTAAYLLVLTPWMVRNGLVFDHLFFSERTAYLTYKLTGRGYVSPHYQRNTIEQEKQGTSPEALDLDDLAYTPGHYVWDFGFARREPMLYTRIIAARLFELWMHPNGLDRLPRPLKLPYQIGHGLILLLAGCGLWGAGRERHWSLLAWCLVLPYITVLSIYFKPNPRYTLPFLPLILILAVVGVVMISESLMRRRAANARIAGDVPGAES